MDSHEPEMLLHILADSPFYKGLLPEEKKQLTEHLLAMYPNLHQMPVHEESKAAFDLSRIRFGRD